MTNKFKNIGLAALIFAVAVVISCSKDKEQEPPDPIPTSVSVPVITITTQPATATSLVEGSISGSLTVTASVTEGATLGYQWYSNTTNSATDGTAISGATGASFVIPTTLKTGTYYYFCGISATGATSIRSGVATVTVTEPKASDPLENVIPSAISETFRKIMPIYTGTTPPDISGEYVCSPAILVGSSLPDDDVFFGEDDLFDDMYFAFIKEANGKYSYIEMQGEYSSRESEDVTVVVVGTGNNFTAYFIATGESNDIPTKTATLISGTLTSEGIANFHYAFILLEKGDDLDGLLVPVNTYRIFVDGKDLAEREEWISESAVKSFVKHYSERITKYGFGKNNQK